MVLYKDRKTQKLTESFCAFCIYKEELKKRGNIPVSKKGWVEGNIFGFKKLDGAAYLAFYILIPVIVTIASLNVLSSESIAMAYCYMTILISSLNSIYDAGNR